MDSIRRNPSGDLVIPAGHPILKGLSGNEEWVVEAAEDGIALRAVTLDVRRVYLEVTRRCNLRCVTCVRHVWTDPQGDMDEETFARVVDQLRAFPDLREVYLGGFGEPLFHPGIVEMVKRIKTLGVQVGMSTNGVLLNRRMAEALMDAGLDQIVISFDSAQPQAFGEIRVGADLNRVLDNAVQFNNLRRARGKVMPFVAIEFVAMKSNLRELVALPELARAVGATTVIITHLLPYTEAMAGEILYDGTMTNWPVPTSWERWAAGRHSWGTLERPRMRWGAARVCRFVEGRSLVIGWDGAVSPCYGLMHSYPYHILGRPKKVTRYVLGNVRQDTLAGIWTSPEYMKFRAKVHAFSFPSCVDCGPRSCCYADVNEDCWDNKPSCADCLWAQDIVRCP